ncbi:MAG: thioredoxin-like domain-containing protein [Gemmatimonas sp.]
MLGIVRAPELARPGLTWFNVKAPLSLADLAGRLVILDFWTFCCINCMHVLKTLAKIEARFPDTVTVIGVHSPKFSAEKDPANVARAIARYRIAHPVIHDPDMTLWHEYAIRAWPTLVFVAPDGSVLGASSGEPDAEKLIAFIDEQLATFAAQGAVKPSLLPADLAPEAPASRLLFPGKAKPVLLPSGARGWAVADSGHHQVALLDARGREVGRYGSGHPGFDDGGAKAATFRDPQGLAANDRTLYVADTGNHAIRAIDLASGRVETIGGTGTRGRILGASAESRATALASPWDIVLVEDVLAFANAGTHQLGALDPQRGIVARLAGTGAEGIEDGVAMHAAMAQPSGLSYDEESGRIFIADSETSSVRFLQLGETPQLSTLVGTGLFDFGYRNGAFGEARLQHCLGLSVRGDEVIVADSYNARLALLDLSTGEVGDVDDGFTCTDAVCLPLAEPAGVHHDGGTRLLVSDTNNHRLVLYDRDARTTATFA